MLQQVKLRRDQLIKKENQRNFLVKAKIQMETMSDNINMKDILSNVNNVMKEGQKAQEELVDQMEDYKDHLEDQKEVEEMMNVPNQIFQNSNLLIGTDAT